MIDITKTELWDPRYNLPTIPQHSNPWIYMALVFKCVPEFKDIANVFEHWLKCYHPPIFYRWPDKTGGNFSHDEILGAAHVLINAAYTIYCELVKYDGYSPDEHGRITENRYMFRFPFLRPFLRARLGMKVSTLSQVLWSLYVLKATVFSKKTKLDADGLLKIWLMSDYTSGYPIMDLTKHIWKLVMKHKGIGPKYLFTEHYLYVCPTMREIAPNGF
jgi:hypothetical protein